MSDTLLASFPFVEILAKVSSTSPSPGGGAVGALAVALGAACGLKAVRISKKHKPGSLLLTEAELGLENVLTAVLPLVDADGVAFEKLLGAFKLPKATPGDTVARRGAICLAAVHAVSIGQAINDTAAQAAAALDVAKSDISANIISDYNAAVALLKANRSIQDENMEANKDIAARFGVAK